MGFTGAELGLNPVALTDGNIFPLRLIRSSHIAKHVSQERAHRINLELIDRTNLRLTSLASGFRIRISPNMFFQRVDRDNLVRDCTDLVQALTCCEKILGIRHTYSLTSHK
ncbi:hypothetical protein ES703_86004 [subsurface metagenome]